MYFTPAIVSALSLASLCTEAVVEKRKSWLFSCGCDSQSDANVNPMNAVKVVHTGPLSSVSVMYQSGNCGLAIGNLQNINGPGGVGGGVSGTTISGADFKDLMTLMLGCHDSAKGLVNVCPSVGAGNAMMMKAEGIILLSSSRRKIHREWRLVYFA
ncbi:hypothetical protein N7539_004691 [Penicillium diatomitis]|uniref:Hydrophobin n=1 Tax=Penicillium diatomitis TaxID=2819901 RepID=A0A9W9X5I0_9EURO|nr:uncharacterized protein N7539_004691 [Penicillium diatomitis]KAJ5484703.1 hypothetical protein N7539_004691 [Penicillium diatomitis]